MLGTWGGSPQAAGTPTKARGQKGVRDLREAESRLVSSGTSGGGGVMGMIRGVGRAGPGPQGPGHGEGFRFRSRELWEVWGCLEKAVI